MWYEELQDGLPLRISDGSNHNSDVYCCYFLTEMTPSELFEGPNSSLRKTYEGATSDFSSFFHNATPEEKKAVMLEVMKEASAEQRRVIEESKICFHCASFFTVRGTHKKDCSRYTEPI